MRTKKGFIMVYTIFVGIICLIMMMYIFDLQVAELKYSTSAKKYILREDKYQKYREYLTTLFYTYIDENDIEIKSKGTKEFFSNIQSVIVSYEKSNVAFDKKENLFIFKIPYGNLVLRKDYFKLEIIDECLKLVFIKTIYENIRP
jgi:hypothetical protein